MNEMGVPVTSARNADIIADITQKKRNFMKKKKFVKSNVIERKEDEKTYYYYCKLLHWCVTSDTSYYDKIKKTLS